MHHLPGEATEKGCTMESKQPDELIEAVYCSGQCPALKLSVLGAMWMFLTHTSYHNIVAD